MSQQDIIRVLEKGKHPLTSKEIAEILDSSEVKIRETLARLVSHNEVYYIEINRRLSMRFFKCKRKMRLYYL